MSHYPGCTRATDSGAIYGVCTCADIQVREQTRALDEHTAALRAQEGRQANEANEVDKLRAALAAEVESLRADKARLDVYIRLCETLDNNAPYWDCETQVWLIPYQVSGAGGFGGGVGTKSYVTLRAAIDAASLAPALAGGKP
jgi:hypothetical protein